MLTSDDLRHLRRCVELAREALADGNPPFGSLLVTGDGGVLFEARNETRHGDATLHPEIEVARWASKNLGAAKRRAATVYTSGEHCPMCSAAHGWAGLGRIVYASSAAQFTAWMREWGIAAGAVRPLAIQDVITGVQVDGPAPELTAEIRELQRRYFKVPA